MSDARDQFGKFLHEVVFKLLLRERAAERHIVIIGKGGDVFFGHNLLDVFLDRDEHAALDDLFDRS